MEVKKICELLGMLLRERSSIHNRISEVYYTTTKVRGQLGEQFAWRTDYQVSVYERGIPEFRSHSWTPFCALIDQIKF